MQIIALSEWSMPDLDVLTGRAWGVAMFWVLRKILTRFPILKFHKDKPTFIMFNTCVMRCSLWSEAQTENITVVRTVPHQETSIRFVGQLRFCIVPREGAPIPSTLKTKIIIIQSANSTCFFFNVFIQYHYQVRILVKRQDLWCFLVFLNLP